MKIPRYQAGRTNVGALESGKASLRTPGQAAWAEGAKYKAISDIADIGTDAVIKFDEARRARKLESDKITFAISEADKTSAYTLLTKDPLLEQKMEDDPEYFTNSVKDIEKQYNQSLIDIGDDRTKKNFQAASQASLSKFMAIAEGDLGQIEFKVEKNRAVGAGAAAELAGDIDGAEVIYEAGEQYFSEAEKANQKIRIKNARTDIQSDSIADDVIAAYEFGGEEAAMDILQAVLTDDELDADVQKMAMSKGKTALSNRMLVDRTEKALYEQKQAQESSMRRIDFEQTITPATSTDDINGFANAEGLSHAERRQLFTLREKKATNLTSFEVANPNTKGYRDGVDEVTQSLRVEGEDGQPVPLTLEQQYDVQIAMLNPANGENQTFGIGTNLTSTMVKAAASSNEETFTQGVMYYADIMNQNPKTKLDFGDSDTTNYYEAAYESGMRMGGARENFAVAAKEQQAIHINKAKGVDSISVANETFNQYVKNVLVEDIGDSLESMGIDIPGAINDSEFQFDGVFMARYLAAGRNITQYMQATEGYVDPKSVKTRALQRTLSDIAPNFVNSGVPSGGRQFLTNKGLQEDLYFKPQMSVNVLDGADTPEGSKHLRSLMMQPETKGGTGLDGKKVKYLGREYTLRADKPLRTESGMQSVMEGDIERGEIRLPDDVIYIEDIELFTGGTLKTDEKGATTADLRYLNMPIYDVTGKNQETWNRYTDADYITPEGMTDVSGGPTRTDVNARIAGQ